MYMMRRVTDTLLTGIKYVPGVSRVMDYAYGNEKESVINHEFIGLTIEERVRKAGYPFETYNVETSDGYLLTLHRIPHGLKGKKNNDKPILLMHGLLGSAHDFVVHKNKSLAYSLADNGYDVWLGNARGTLYSRKSDDANEFWRFSWHEIGIYDVSAFIDHILEFTKKEKLCFIGYSQGAAAFCVLTSIKPEYNEKISLVVFIAPAVFVQHYTFIGPFRNFCEYEILITWFIKLMSMLLTKVSYYQKILDFTVAEYHEFPVGIERFRRYCKQLVRMGGNFQTLAEHILSELLGIPMEYLAKDAIPVIYNASPSSASYKQVLHYAQNIDSGSFRQFDYGVEINTKVYNNPVPPDYNLKNVTAPVAMFYSKYDSLAPAQDNEKLIQILPNVIHKQCTDDKSYTHFSFLFGNNANKIHSELVRLLEDKLK